MSVAAVIPLTELLSANAVLEAQGFGEGNFSVPLYDAPRANFAALHAWDNTAFAGAVKSAPGVKWSEIAGRPPDRVVDAVAKLAPTATWASNAKPLAGPVTPGLHFDPDDFDGPLWWVIQPFDRAVFTQPLDELPALVRRARTPGVALPWVQPLDQFDAYRALDPWTGAGEVATHNGKTWRVTQGDGAGNNVWQPGVFGWEEIA